jgi:hypothetical protein
MDSIGLITVTLIGIFVLATALVVLLRDQQTEIAPRPTPPPPQSAHMAATAQAAPTSVPPPSQESDRMPTFTLPNTPLPTAFKRLQIPFQGGKAYALLVPKDADPQAVKRALGIERRPALFITGGAGGMTDQDAQQAQQIIVDGLARFAHDHQMVIVDGGTDSGVMQMIGEARRTKYPNFILVGVAPLHKVSFPGHVDASHEAALNEGHTCFVLVDGAEWGDESNMIVRLTSAVCGDAPTALGVLINGGKISRHDVFMARQNDLNLPILVLEGSGRFADELATASKTGESTEAIIKAILERGNIQIIGTNDGAQGMYQALQKHFMNVGGAV